MAWQRVFVARAHRALGILTTGSSFSVVINSAIVTAIVGTCLALLPSSPPYLVITARTEMLQYRVTRPDLSALPLVSAEISGAGMECGALIADAEPGVLIVPAYGTIVRYRWRAKALAIDLERSKPVGTVTKPLPIARLSLRNEQYCDITAPMLSIRSIDPPALLPIIGPTQIGTETAVAVAPSGFQNSAGSGILHEGEIKVFGRAFLPPFRGALYPVPDAVYPIPRGSRLISGPNLKDAHQLGADFFGSALFGPTGLDVSVTADAGELRLFRPGTDGQSEVFAVGLVTKVFNDPSIALWSLLSLTVFGVVFQCMQQLAAFQRVQRAEDD